MRLIIESELKEDGRWLAEVWYIPKKANGVKGAINKEQAHERKIIASGSNEIIIKGRGEGIKAYGHNREEAIAKAQALALKIIADRLEQGELLAGPINITYVEENAYLIDKIKAFLEDYISFFDVFDKDNKFLEASRKIQKGEDLNEKDKEIIGESCMKALFLKTILEIKESIIIPDPILFVGDAKILLDIASEFMDNADNIVIRRIYEDYFIPKLIDGTPNMIRRAMVLRRYFCNNKPSDKLLQYCKEAFLTFIYGFHNSSVILLRTVLETALKEKFNVDVGTFGTLNNYLYKNGLIPKEVFKINCKVNKDARDAVHNLAKGIEISEGKTKHLIEIASKNLKLIFS